MNLERWLRETGKWIEETGKPLGSWIEETGRRLNPEDRSGVSEDGARDWSMQVSLWGSHFTERLREWSSDPGRALEDFDKLGGQIQEEWSAMAEWLQLGERYRDAIQTLVGIYIRNRFEQLGKSSGSPEKTSLRHRQNAEELVGLCRRQGGAWVKAAQFLSSQGDWLPEEYRSPLSELQDHAPAIPWESVESVLLEVFGKEWSNRFRGIDHEPVATASLAQVHRASLPDGTAVALKIQLPDAPQRIEADLRFFSLASRLLKDLLPGMDTEQVVRELSRSILLELDYVREAENLVRFRERYKSPEWLGPELIPELLTAKTLGMGFIEGTPIRVFLTEAPSAAKAVLKTLASSFMHQIFLCGLFHSDPHPGNFFVTPQGLIALLDLGSVGELSPEETGAYREVLLALLIRQAEGMVEKLEEAGFRVEQPEFLMKTLFPESKCDDKEAAGDSEQKSRFRGLTGLENQLRVMREAGVELPDSFVLMARVLISLGGLMNQHRVKFTPAEWGEMLMQQT